MSAPPFSSCVTLCICLPSGLCLPTVEMSFNTFSPSNSSFESLHLYCSDSLVDVITTASNITRAVLILPLSIFILYLGHQQWQKQRSFTKMNHIDIFTYHTLAMELIWLLGSICYYCGTYVNVRDMMKAGYCTSCIAFYGEVLFNLLTCVERYLAVVHPIVYIGLRNARGVRIRNISIGCVWLLCIACVSVTVWCYPSSPSIQMFCFLIFSLVVVSFCSLSVLCVLIRPGPAGAGRDKEQPKRRAFFTITAITGVLWLWFVVFLVSIVVHKSQLLSYSVSCLVIASGGLLNLPCSLVIPLLYLQRAGKLCCCYVIK